jgi:DNA-binding MarR family transcriptional regulator
MSPPETLSALSDHLGFWLRAVSNQVSHDFARKLTDLDVTVAEWVVLRTLYGRDPLAPSQVASELGLTRGAITRLADRLLVRGLIERTPSPADGRAQTLTLTTRGANLVPDLAALADTNDAEWFGGLDPTDRATLLRILRQLLDRSDTFTTPVS